MRIQNFVAVVISIIVLFILIISIYWSQKKPIPVIIQAGHEGTSWGRYKTFKGKNCRCNPF